MQLRHLEFLVSVERERHFARAASECNVSQPTLSAGIAALEAQLGVRLVERDRRYIGLTAEGQAVLPWAQHILAAGANMAAAVGAAVGPLKGVLRLGIIPASMPCVGVFTHAMRTAHEALELDVRALTSREIVGEIAAFRLDGGITYIDHEPPAHVEAIPLYVERPMAVVGAQHPLASATAIGFEHALDQPLCLLHQGMQNRRILDEQLALRGLEARPCATADSYVSLLAMVRANALMTIMPDSYRRSLPAWARIVPFEGAVYASRIGLILSDRQPRSPLAEAARAVAETLLLPSEFGPL